RATFPHARGRRSETYLVARPRRTHGQSIRVTAAALSAGISHAHLVFTVARWVEEQLRILAEAGATVVVLVVDRYDRQTIGWKRGPRWMDGDLVHRRSVAVVRRRCAEVAQSLPGDAEKLTIVVRIARQCLDAQHFVADQDVIVHGELVPGLQADAGGRG